MLESLSHVVGPAAAFAFLLLVVGLLAYFGVFQGIYFLPTTFGPTTMVGLRAIGPYKNSGRTFQQVSALVKDHKLEDSLDFYAGLFHDDPKRIPESKCRSFIGYCTKEPLTKAQQGKLHDLGLRTRDIPAVPCLSTTFPYINVLSFIISALCVYPAMNKKLAEKIPIMEKENQDCESGILESYHVDEGHIAYHVPRDSGAALRDIDLLDK